MAAPAEPENGDSLLLYHWQTSFFSTKVRVALAVKGLSYRKQTVKIHSGENEEPWFMRLNPVGVVPVLEHDGKIITESSRIIDYLDTAFQDRGPRLAPPEDTDLGRRVRHFRDLLDDLPVRMYTKATVYHPDLAKDSMMSGRSRLSSSKAQQLRELAATYPDLAEAYTSKAEKVEQLIRDLEDRDLVEKLLDNLAVVLDEVEKELAERKKDQEASGQQQWLCGVSFTAADVMLSCLLHRLRRLGLAHRFFPKRPLLAAYYLQAQDFAQFKAEATV